MSNETKGSTGYSPSRKPATFTIAEMREMGEFFSGLLNKSGIKWVFYAGGIAAICDICHTVWLCCRYVFKF